MTVANREMLAWLAAICVLALVTAGGTEVAAAHSLFPGLATYDWASRLSAC